MERVSKNCAMCGKAIAVPVTVRGGVPHIMICSNMPQARAHGACGYCDMCRDCYCFDHIVWKPVHAVNDNRTRREALAAAHAHKASASLTYVPMCPKCDRGMTAVPPSITSQTAIMIGLDIDSEGVTSGIVYATSARPVGPPQTHKWNPRAMTTGRQITDFLVKVIVSLGQQSGEIVSVGISWPGKVIHNRILEKSLVASHLNNREFQESIAARHTVLEQSLGVPVSVVSAEKARRQWQSMSGQAKSSTKRFWEFWK